MITRRSEGKPDTLDKGARLGLGAFVGGCMAGLALAVATDVWPTVGGGVALVALIALCVGGTLAFAVRSRAGIFAAMVALICLFATGGLWLLRGQGTGQGAVNGALARLSATLQTPEAGDGLALANLQQDGVPAAIAERFLQNRALIEGLAQQYHLGVEPFLTHLAMLDTRDDLDRFDDVFLLTSLARDASRLLGVLTGGGAPEVYGDLADLVRRGEFAKARGVIVAGLESTDLTASLRAKLLIVQAGLEEMALRDASAGRHYQEAAELLEAEERPGVYLGALRAFYRDGAMWGRPDSLDHANRFASDLADGGPDDVVTAISYQLQIARAFRRLPQDAGDPLARANTILLQAIASASRLDAPDMLAKLHLELGIVLREAGAVGPDSDQLKQAINALRLAQSPAAALDVEMAGQIENELGLAHRLLAQADREERQSMAAVTHYRQALKILEHSADARDLSLVRINLAVALRFSGMARKDAALLDEAATTFEAALAGLDNREARLDWVTAQTELAHTLLAKGETFNDIEALEKAVSAYKKALEGAQSDGRSALGWAKTQNGLANALQTLGERTNKRTNLEEALTAREGAWILYQFSGQDNYDFYFENRIANQRAYLEMMGT